MISIIPTASKPNTITTPDTMTSQRIVMSDLENVPRYPKTWTKDAPKATKTFESIDAPGYPRLADLMAQCNEAAIFRRFRSLNLLNLMRLQAELVELEECLKVLFKSNEIVNPCIFQDFYEVVDGDNKEVHELLIKIACKLEDYNKTLLELSQVAALKSPHKAELHFIQRWLRGLEEGEGQSFLNGAETKTWKNLDIDEFFVMGADRSDADAATGRIVDWLITTYNHRLGRKFKRTADPKLGMIKYSGLKTTAKFLNTLLSSMLPALSILALYYERNILNRIGIMISLTFVFAAALTFGTSAKRIEIFAATAAFAAVEVVFIGSTDAGNGTKPA